MRQLSLRARLYLACCYLVGEIVFCWFMSQQPLTALSTQDWLLGIGLTTIGIIGCSTSRRCCSPAWART